MKHLLLAALFFQAAFAFGQEIPDLILGGTMNFNYYQSEGKERISVQVSNPVIILPGPNPTTFTSRIVDVEQTRTSLAIAPYVGRVINSKFTFGLGLDLSVTQVKTIRQGSEQEVSGNRFGAYLWGRYTVNPAQRLSFYAEPQLGYSRAKGGGAAFVETGTFLTSDGITKITGLNVPLCFTYGFSSRLFANVRVGGLVVQSGKWEADSSEQQRSWLDAGLRLNPRTISIGVEFLL